jgi:hypothetical protein
LLRLIGLFYINGSKKEKKRERKRKEKKAHALTMTASPSGPGCWARASYLPARRIGVNQNAELFPDNPLWIDNQERSSSTLASNKRGK